MAVRQNLPVSIPITAQRSFKTARSIRSVVLIRVSSSVDNDAEHPSL